MELKLITAIAEGNFSAILNITSQLTDSERYSTIAAIRVLDPSSEKISQEKILIRKIFTAIKTLFFKRLTTLLSLWCVKKAILPK